ncbi:MAG TPA: hypothetical protein VFI65_00945 [Streptosporangiaceae bacterium]|nr:hypothetical protein [Streptosporangiaceae bacterium]
MSQVRSQRREHKRDPSPVIKNVRKGMGASGSHPQQHGRDLRTGGRIRDRAAVSFDDLPVF